MVLVELYSKDNCSLCDIAKDVLVKVRQDVSFEFREIKLKDDDELFAEFGTKIPLVFINGRLSFKYHVYELELKEKILRELRQAV
jgi:glutaredoxin